MHYFLGFLALPTVLLLGGRWASTQRRLLALAVASAILVYGITVASAYATSAVYSHQADALDTDGDGIISLAEQSAAQSEAMDEPSMTPEGT
jgi:hypothetical protein